MEKQFLGTCVVSGLVTSIDSLPSESVTFIVPSLSVAAVEDFETVTIDPTGAVFRSGTGSPCPLIAVPLVFAASNQSATTGDMELDTYVAIPVEKRETVYHAQAVKVTKTRAYPDGNNVSLVLLSGQLEIVDSAFKGRVTLACLPAGCRPSLSYAHVCSLRGDFIDIRPDGLVDLNLVGNGSASTVYLDSVRFSTAPAAVIRGRFPHRSCIHAIGELGPGRLEVSGAFFDLILPVTVDVDSGPFLTCMALTRAGHVVPLWDAKPDDEICPVFLSSLVTAEASENPTSGCGILGNSTAQLRDLVAQKLSAITFSQLANEEEGKCMRRDREWRRTGLKAPRF